MIAPTETRGDSFITPSGLALMSRMHEAIANLPPAHGELVHRFTPGMYARQILMKAGQVHLSKIHKTEHQFIISQGVCLVRERDDGPWVMHVAPFHGITKPGTWRTLFILMDCVWTTFHPTNKTTVEEVEADIIHNPAQ